MNKQNSEKKYYSPEELSNALNALSTCAHILRLSNPENQNEENLESLNKIWGNARVVADIIGKMLTTVPINGVINEEKQNLEQEKTVETESKPVEQPIVTEPEKKEEVSEQEKQQQEIKKEETIVEETTVEETTVEETTVEETTVEETTVEETTVEETTVEETTETVPVRASNEQTAYALVFDKIAAFAASKKITKIDHISPQERVGFKQLIKDVYPADHELANAKMEKPRGKLITRILVKYLEMQKQNKQDIIKDKEAGETLLQQIENTKKVENIKIVNSPDNTKEISNKKEESKKETKVDYWEMLQKASTKEQLTNAVVGLRMRLGTGNNNDSEFQKKKIGLGKGIQSKLIQRVQKEPELKKIIDSCKGKQESGITGLLLDSFAQASMQLAVAQ